MGEIFKWGVINHGQQVNYAKKQMRLLDYDYRNEGAYHVVLVNHYRQHYFGEITNDVMLLSSKGEAAEALWLEIPSHFPNVRLDEYIFMPNHMHGILVFDNTGLIDDDNGKRCIGQNERGSQSRSLSAVIQSYKSAVTRIIRQKFPGMQIWQPNFYDRIIRNEIEYERIRMYIGSNIEHWPEDEENKK